MPSWLNSCQPFLGVVFCLPRSCYALACFSSSTLFWFGKLILLTKNFWPSCMTCTQGKHVRSGLKLRGFRIVACFRVITACLGVNAACFPVRLKKFLKGCRHWPNGLISWKAPGDMLQIDNACTCNRIQLHVGSKMGSIHSPNGWQRSSYHQSSMSTNKTYQIKACVVFGHGISWSITACLR